VAKQLKHRDHDRQAFYSRPRKTQVRRGRDIQIGDPIGKLVWMIICDHAGSKDGGISNAKLMTIWHETELARSTVCDWIAEFKRQGRITPRRNGRCVEYIVHIPQGEGSAMRTEKVRNTNGQVRNTDSKVRSTDPSDVENSPETSMDSAFSEGAEKSKASKAFRKERESDSPSARPSLHSIDSGKRKVTLRPPKAQPMRDDWQPSDDTVEHGIKRGMTDSQARASLAKFKDSRTGPRRDICSCDWQASAWQWLDNERLPRSATATPENHPPTSSATDDPYLDLYVCVDGGVIVDVDTPQWLAWKKHWNEVRGRVGSPPKTDIRDPATGRLRRGWKFKTEWPPEYKPESKAAA
jgi:hypothetical protein